MNKFNILSLAIFALFSSVFYLIADFSTVSLYGILIFGFLILISEHLNIDLKNNSGVSVSFLFMFSACVLFGYTTGALAALFGSVIYEDIKNKTSGYVLLINGSQLGLATLVSGFIYERLNEYILIVNSAEVFSSFYGVLTVCVSASCFFLINSLATYYGAGLRSGGKVKWLTKLNLVAYTLNYLAMVPLIFATVNVFSKSGIIGLFMLIAPLMIVRHMFITYMQSHENAASIIKTLTSAIEAKDKYTRQHSERVAGYANAIARSMSMPEKELVQLNYAAYLHDIGKMAVQRRVLNKPQKLTDLEFNLMKRHPAVGHRIVNQIEMLKHVSEPILKHHEFINGRGYPLGTTDLPLSARIIAVADAFDAMTSLRPYRQPLSIDQAFSELEKNSGTQFDPAIVQYLKKGLAYEDQVKIKHDKPTVITNQLQLDIAV